MSFRPILAMHRVKMCGTGKRPIRVVTGGGEARRVHRHYRYWREQCSNSCLASANPPPPRPNRAPHPPPPTAAGGPTHGPTAHVNRVRRRKPCSNRVSRGDPSERPSGTRARVAPLKAIISVLNSECWMQKGWAVRSRTCEALSLNEIPFLCRTSAASGIHLMG